MAGIVCFYKVLFELVDHPKSNNDFVGADEFGMSRCLVVGRVNARRGLLSGAIEANAIGVVANRNPATLQSIQDSLYILKCLRVNVSIIQSDAEQGSLDLADFDIFCSVFHADSHGAIRFS